jgi:hypothetical protein
MSAMSNSPAGNKRLRPAYYEGCSTPVNRPRVRTGASTGEIVPHFRLDVRHADAATGLAVEVGARPLAWPEAQRLDQLLRQAPSRFVRGNPGLEALVLVDRDGIGRKGAYRPETGRIVIYQPGQSLARPDEDVPGCSVFVATVAHELGEAAWDHVLTDEQRRHYAAAVASGEYLRVSEEFADLVMLGIPAPELVHRVEARAFLRELGLRL